MAPSTQIYRITYIYIHTHPQVLYTCFSLFFHERYYASLACNIPIKSTLSNPKLLSALRRLAVKAHFGQTWRSFSLSHS